MLTQSPLHHPIGPTQLDLDSLTRLRTEACPVCGTDGLPLSVQTVGSYRYLGWSCPTCDLTGVYGICPPVDGAAGRAEP